MLVLVALGACLACGGSIVQGCRAKRRRAPNAACNVALEVRTQAGPDPTTGLRDLIRSL